MSFHLILWLRYLSRVSPGQWRSELTKDRVLALVLDFRNNNENPSEFLLNMQRE